MHNRAAQEGEVGFEEGMLWLPSQVLYEACDIKARQQHLRPFHHHRGGHHRHHRRVSRSLPAGELTPNNSKSSPMRPPYRPKYVQNWASGGPGMQAIFLGSNQKSCGTGVFLPQIRTAGTNNHPNTNKKPACAPVLLPSRVVQALNLNVQALGLQISPRQDLKNNRKGEAQINNISVKSKKGNINKDVPSSQCSVISQKRNSSPELFLPKEWTY